MRRSAIHPRTCKKGSLLKVSDRILQVKLTMQAKKSFDIFHIKGFFAFAGFVIGLDSPQRGVFRFLVNQNF